MDPTEARDLGLPSASESVAVKLKWVARRLMISRCALAPPNVKVKGDSMQRIVATLVHKFKNMTSNQRIIRTPFLAVKHKHVRHKDGMNMTLLYQILVFIIGSTAILLICASPRRSLQNVRFVQSLRGCCGKRIS